MCAFVAGALSGERGDGVTVPGDDAALTDERLAAAWIDRHVRIRALAVEGEQVGHAERIAVILLDDGAAIHAENAGATYFILVDCIMKLDT